MFYYRIAILTLESEYRLQSFDAFVCEESKADVTLKTTDKVPQSGQDLVSGSIVHRIQPDGWFFHPNSTDQIGLFVNHNYTHLLMKGYEGEIVSGKNEWLIRIALECWLTRHGYISLHAAAVELNGQALAFTGPSGLGKSTRADMTIRSLGAKLINGDRPLICVKDQSLYGVPWDGKEQCFRNVHYPLQTICEVRRSESVYVRKMSFQQRRKLLLRQAFMPMWDTETVMLQMANLSKIAMSFPIVRIFCGPEEKDIEALYDILQKQTFLPEEPEIKATNEFILKNMENKHFLIPKENNKGALSGALLLNEVSALVWEKLQNPLSREDLLTAILDEFDVDKSVASDDLDILLEKLYNYGVINNE